MKTVAVIGANGRSGKLFVKHALSNGFRVRAGVYSETHDLPHHELLETIHTDATNYDDVLELLDGADIVVSLIGHVRKSPARVQTNAMKVITRAMNERGISRIISLTGTGARQPGDTPSLLDIALNFPLKLVDPNRINDGIEHVKALQATDLDWTVLRVLKLTNGNKKPYTLTMHGPGKLFVSRDEVADAILSLIREKNYFKETPVIS